MLRFTRTFVAVACRYERSRGFHVGVALRLNGVTPVDPTEIRIPDYRANPNETAGVKRARLLYQSRKRGMLENDLLLSTFVDKYLASMEPLLLTQYDRLINAPYSDWDIYYWALGTRPTPPEYENQVMRLLREHVQNKAKEQRFKQPDLPKEPFEK